MKNPSHYKTIGCSKITTLWSKNRVLILLFNTIKIFNNIFYCKSFKLQDNLKLNNTVNILNRDKIENNVMAHRPFITMVEV